jgi:hypothetical protein
MARTMRVVRAFFFLFAAIFAIACAKSPDPKSPAKQAKLCGLGETAHACALGYYCQTLIPAPSYNDPPPPNGPSYVGGGCGGVAGFHCADGLFCQMPDDQQYVADGMGTCVANSQCVLPRPGIAPDVD